MATLKMCFLEAKLRCNLDDNNGNRKFEFTNLSSESGNPTAPLTVDIVDNDDTVVCGMQSRGTWAVYEERLVAAADVLGEALCAPTE